jgi:hypothetical protein
VKHATILSPLHIEDTRFGRMPALPGAIGYAGTWIQQTILAWGAQNHVVVPVSEYVLWAILPIG